MSSNLAVPTIDRRGNCSLHLMQAALFQDVLEAFSVQGWAYREVEGREVVESAFEAHHGKVSLHVQAYSPAGLVSVVAQCSVLVPPSHRAVAAQLLMRANESLNLGALELLWDRGEVVFRVGNLFAAPRGDAKVIAALVHAAIAEIDRITPCVAEVCRQPAHSLGPREIAALLAREDWLPTAAP